MLRTPDRADVLTPAGQSAHHEPRKIPARGPGKPYRPGHAQPHHLPMNITNTSSRPWWPRPVLALGLVLPLVLIAAGTTLDRAGGPPVEAYLARLNGAPQVYLASGMLLWAGMALLPLTAVALFRVSETHHRRTALRLGAIGLVAWGIGGTTGVGLGYTAGMVSAAVQNSVQSDVLHQVFDGITYSPWGNLGAGILGGGGALIGTIVTAIGILMGGAKPRWAGIPMLLALPVFAIAGGPNVDSAVTGIAFLLIAVSLAALTPQLYREASRDPLPNTPNSSHLTPTGERAVLPPGVRKPVA